MVWGYSDLLLFMVWLICFGEIVVGYGFFGMCWLFLLLGVVLFWIVVCFVCEVFDVCVGW